MTMVLARYKGEIGYMAKLAHGRKVQFITNGRVRTVMKEELDSGDYIIPIPFYSGREIELVKANSNGSFEAKFKKVIGVNRFSRNSTIHILSTHMEWFLVDAKNWENDRRVNVRIRYGLKNLDHIAYQRKI